MSSDASGNAPNSSDRLFVKKAIEGGNVEVQLGQLASQKAQSEDVKHFAQKMVTDHTQMADQLKPIAQQLSMKAPTGVPEKDKKLYDKLQGLSGELAGTPTILEPESCAWEILNVRPVGQLVVQKSHEPVLFCAMV
jgi:predicted outer membrane protein